MLWKIQEICSKMGTKIFEIDEEMSEIIDAKVGNSQNSKRLGCFGKFRKFAARWAPEF